MFLSTKPQVRYPVATAMLVIGAYLYHLLPGLPAAYVTIYLLMVGMFAWEFLLGFAVMIAIFVAFKLLFKLPLGVAILLLVAAIFLAGV